jgi:hypothetical protein
MGFWLKGKHTLHVFNHLKPEINRNNTKKNQFIPHINTASLHYKTSRLILFREMIIIGSKKHMGHKHTV